MKDPFEDEAQAETPVEDPDTVMISKERARTDLGYSIAGAGTSVVDQNPNGEHVVTLKGGSGYDAPWYVIHASGLEELEELFGGGASRLAALFERIQQAGKHFVKLGGGAPAPARAASAPPQGATQAPSWMPAPPAADWVYKSGVKNGKTWHAWAPAQKGGGDWQFHRAPESK